MEIIHINKKTLFSFSLQLNLNIKKNKTGIKGEKVDMNLIVFSFFSQI